MMYLIVLIHNDGEVTRLQVGCEAVADKIFDHGQTGVTLGTYMSVTRGEISVPFNGRDEREMARVEAILEKMRS